MAYTLIASYRSPNFYTPAQCLLHYFRPRTIQGITIHWWGLPSSGQTFSGVTSELCRAGVGKSAHYVAEAGRVNRIVDDRNAAWHSGSKTGNATTIGIECNPRQSDGDYQTVAELVRDLRRQYGDLPLWPHNHWFATACPGTYDLARIDALARVGQVSTVTTAPPAPVIVTPATPLPATPALALAQEDDMPTIYDAPGRGLWLADGSGPLVGISSTGEADALTARGVQRLPVTAAVLDQIRANRLGVELLFSPSGFAVGSATTGYTALGKQTEVDHWKSLGAVQRSVDAETFANLTA